MDENTFNAIMFESDFNSPDISWAKQQLLIPES